MLENSRAFSSFAAPDLAAARTFYADTLGLTVTEEQGLLTLQLPGDRGTMIYEKPDHAPANYTVLHFPVDDLEATVDELSSRGVSFERYEGFEQDEKGISRAGGPPIAWFTDPAGNILGVLQLS